MIDKEKKNEEKQIQEIPVNIHDILSKKVWEVIPNDDILQPMQYLKNEKDIQYNKSLWINIRVCKKQSSQCFPLPNSVSKLSLPQQSETLNTTYNLPKNIKEIDTTEERDEIDEIDKKIPISIKISEESCTILYTIQCQLQRMILSESKDGQQYARTGILDSEQQQNSLSRLGYSLCVRNTYQLQSKNFLNYTDNQDIPTIQRDSYQRQRYEEQEDIQRYIQENIKKLSKDTIDIPTIKPILNTKQIKNIQKIDISKINSIDKSNENQIQPPLSHTVHPRVLQCRQLQQQKYQQEQQQEQQETLLHPTKYAIYNTKDDYNITNNENTEYQKPQIYQRVQQMLNQQEQCKQESQLQSSSQPASLAEFQQLQLELQKQQENIQIRLSYEMQNEQDESIDYIKLYTNDIDTAATTTTNVATTTVTSDTDNNNNNTLETFIKIQEPFLQNHELQKELYQIAKEYKIYGFSLNTVLDVLNIPLTMSDSSDNVTIFPHTIFEETQTEDDIKIYEEYTTIHEEDIQYKLLPNVQERCVQMLKMTKSQELGPLLKHTTIEKVQNCAMKMLLFQLRQQMTLITLYRKEFLCYWFVQCDTTGHKDIVDIKNIQNIFLEEICYQLGITLYCKNKIFTTLVQYQIENREQAAQCDTIMTSQLSISDTINSYVQYLQSHSGFYYYIQDYNITKGLNIPFSDTSSESLPVDNILYQIENSNEYVIEIVQKVKDCACKSVQYVSNCLDDKDGRETLS